METLKKKLGADHPYTLTSMANLASTFAKQGRWDAAEELEVQVMETRKKILGADHPDTLTVMSNLAFTWKRTGKGTEAVRLMEECIQSRKRAIGLDHPDTLSSCSALAVWKADEEFCSAFEAGASLSSLVIICGISIWSCSYVAWCFFEALFLAYIALSGYCLRWIFSRR
jgi:hypothetical protein